MSDQTTNTLVKENPPEIRRRQSTNNYADELAPLLDDPGEWYRFRSGLDERQARSLAYYLKKFNTDDGHFETSARKFEDGTAGVWVRYVAGETPAPKTRRRKSMEEQPAEAAVA